MNKMVSKLIMTVMALILAVSVVVMSTYAWMILSKSPAVEGIQITIGGGNTILIAPNVTETVDGREYHYPGMFKESLNFSQTDSYDYLLELGGLSPVSTANGLDWFVSGADGYALDDSLAYANLPKGAAEISAGNYVYLDFWVVSPGEDYVLRVSSDGGAGSFAIDLPELASTENGYELTTNTQGSAAACARIGFLVNDIGIVDDTMLHYQRSPGGSNQYTRLKGVFGADRQDYSFYIYEPNGDYHPDAEVARPGSYVETNPMALVDSKPTKVSVRDQLSVQLTNQWLTSESGNLQIAERFQTAIAGKDLSNMGQQEIKSYFYRDYLQQQVSPYVQAAKFVTSTQLLYEAANAGVVDAEKLSLLPASGATDDTFIIQLEKNVPQRIRMVVWLEGLDVDCASSAFADSLVLGLELAGGSN